ncbi:MAG: hypothetical protein Q8Q54_01405 [Methylococcales bacterium]|nr:hypothetical protein [Methylococcales bacterium]MDP3837557.1 hypothetical protein [Methylococcales bacterium]
MNIKQINQNNNSLLFSLLLVSLLFNRTVMASVDDNIDQNDGSLSGEFPHIPEPMVFDLVRPLGTTKGEFEINNLSRYNNQGHFDWAPEIEYAIHDGLAIELELPFSYSNLEEIKMATQWTLPDSSHHFIHGLQAIGRYVIKEASYSADFLYIAGYRFNEKWSTLNMLGLRTEDISKRTKLQGLTNLNLFYNLGENIVVGVEMNNEFNKKKWHLNAVPQLHFNLSDNLSVQTGAGSSFNKHKQWSINGRLIYAF